MAANNSSNSVPTDIETGAPESAKWHQGKLITFLLVIGILNLPCVFRYFNIIPGPVSFKVVLLLGVQFLISGLLTYVVYLKLIAIKPYQQVIARLYHKIRVTEPDKKIESDLDACKYLRVEIEKYWWGGLRDQVLSAIGPKPTKREHKELKEEVRWFSRKESNSIDKDQKPSRSWWLRLLKLFNESTNIYIDKEKVLLDPKDDNALTLDRKTFEKNRNALIKLSKLIGVIVRNEIVLYALKWTPRLIIFWSIVVFTNILAVQVLGFRELYNWWIPSSWLILGIGIALLFPPIAGYLLRYVTRGVGIASENLFVDVLTGPILASIIAGFIYKSVQTIPVSFKSELSISLAAQWENPLNRVLIVLILAWLTIFLLKDLIKFILDKWSETLTLKYDETFVSVVQNVASVYILLIASAVLLVSFRDRLGITSPESILLPYVLVVSVVTGILGYASRESLENFFAGVMLRVNPPFRKGDRIMLQDGQICDVREMGMRTVTLYDVLLNAEMYMPNILASTMTVTNVSRPDVELRIQIPVHIRATPDSLKKAECMLVNIAYSEPEVDQMIIHDDEFGDTKKFWTEERDRRSVSTEITNLMRVYPKIKTTTVTTGENAIMHNKTFEEIQEIALDAIKGAREKYTKCDSKEKAQSIDQVIENYHKLANAIYAIGDANPELKEDLDVLITELSKEPVVHSRLEVSPSGVTYVVATLNVFAIHLERRFDVEQKLNKEILDQLGKAGILLA